MEKLKDIVIKYDSLQDMKKLIEIVKGSSMNLVTAINDEGEDVRISAINNELEVTTNQNNSWVRINYYDLETAMLTGETFNGRWK